MTAKGRGEKLSSNGDVYETPGWPVRRFLEEWDLFESVGDRWIEPCAGKGNIVKTVNEERAKRGLDPLKWTLVELRNTRIELEALARAHVSMGVTMEIHTGVGFVGKRVEISEKGREIVIDDPAMKLWTPPKAPEVKILTEVAAKWKPFDVAIFNPPFALTIDFLILCMRLARHVVMLQRQNFPASKERNEWIRSDTPDFYLIPDRVDFSGDGKADAIGHGWYAWEEERRPLPLFRPLKHTLKQERKADRPRVSLRAPQISAGMGKPRRKKPAVAT